MTADPYHSHIQGGWNAALGQEPPPADSILPPLEGTPGRKEWDPVPITRLGVSRPPDWLWRGYLAPGLLTLFTGIWKGGKSTLFTWLLADLQRGGGLVAEAMGVRSLVVTEEAPSHWCKRREERGLDGNVHIMTLPFSVRPTFEVWRQFVEHLRTLTAEHGYRLIILDTISPLWPVEDENNASQVTAAIMPLKQLVLDGVAVLVSHHPRKGDAGEGQASRGSGALPSIVDIIVELRRMSPEDPGDRRRVLRAYSRHEDTPAVSVIELGEEGYTVVGDSARCGRLDRLAAISALLSKHGLPMTPEEVVAAWPAGVKPSAATVARDLRAGAAGGRWTQTGNGHKGSPFRYAAAAGSDSPPPHPIAGRKESAGGNAGGEVRS